VRTVDLRAAKGPTEGSTAQFTARSARVARRSLKVCHSAGHAHAMLKVSPAGRWRSRFREKVLELDGGPLAVALSAGGQLLALGILGDYLGRSLAESQRRLPSGLVVRTERVCTNVEDLCSVT
jgi:hypothetical protein